MIIPALDLIDGKVVRLLQGDYARQTDYQADPACDCRNISNKAPNGCT